MAGIQVGASVKQRKEQSWAGFGQDAIRMLGNKHRTLEPAVGCSCREREKDWGNLLGWSTKGQAFAIYFLNSIDTSSSPTLRRLCNSHTWDGRPWEGIHVEIGRQSHLDINRTISPQMRDRRCSLGQRRETAAAGTDILTAVFSPLKKIYS